jgi:protocatechuate 3,4-dioxygenase beta subunit
LGCATKVPPSDTDEGSDTDGDTDGDTGSDTDVDTDTTCEVTADNIEGPFYISDAPVRTDLDLYGHTGESLRISGLLLDAECKPITGGVIEVWHSRPDGSYDNDSSEMEYRGQFAPAADGRWEFETLMPGKYLNGSSYRPAHIHVKVWVNGVEALTTQLYFAGDSHLASDPWALPELTLTLSETSNGLEGVFDIVVT